MPAAFDKETGALKYVLGKDGKWAAPVIADNPETGERYYLDGAEWKPVPLDDNERGAGIATAALQGPTLGFGDELTAALENPGEALGAISRFGPGQLGATILGKNGPAPETPGYDASLEKFRRIEDRYRQAEPGNAFAITAATGLAGGGVQLGRGAFNATARALPRAGRLGAAAATGAEFGAVAGFGSGEGGAADRLVSSVFGAGTGAALGGVIETAAPALTQIYRMLRGNPRLFNPQTNTLTREGEMAMREAGFDPATASAAMQREFGEQARNALNPGEAVSVAEARSLPVPVRQTRGQTTLRPDDQMFETQAAKDVYGQNAGAPIRQAFDAQQDALRANVPAIGERIAGGQSRVHELGQGTQQAQQALSAAERAADSRVNRLYDAARKGKDASVSQDALTQGVHDINMRLGASFHNSSIPKVAAVLEQLKPAVTAGGKPEILVSDLFRIRSNLAGLQGELGVEGAAAGHAKRALDRWMTSLLKEKGALLSGDSKSLNRWRRAIKSRAEYGERFESDDLVSSLVERARVGGESVLKLDANGAVNEIFGRAASGWTSKGGMVRDLTRVRDELGATSPHWNALREEAFLRFANTAEGAANPTGRTFSGANFAKAWNKALRETPEVMRILFNDQERALISQFARVAQRTTVNVAGGNNSSNTGAAVAQSVRRMFASAFMGPKMAAFMSDLPVVRAISNLGYTIKAEGAARNTLQRGYRQSRTVNRSVERATGPLASAVVQSAFGR